MDTFDPQYIQRIRQYGGDQLVHQMVELFFTSGPDRTQEILSALRSDDLERAERVAHSLKSSAGNLGAVRAQRLAEAIEHACHNGDADSAKTNATMLEEAIGEALTILSSYRQSQPCTESR